MLQAAQTQERENGLRIGTLTLSSRLILAPLASISDLPFRLLNRKFGCELSFVEMINARSLGYRSKKTAEMLATSACDKPLGVQLLGCEPRYIERGLDILAQYRFDILDFNAACPMKKVIRRGEGAALMKDPKRLQGLLKIIVRRSAVPVTAKIRTGWDGACVNAREVALYAQEAGIAALFIHGRTRTQIYSGPVDYATIAEVKRALSIPVIASGNLFSAQLAKKMFEETGCDGLSIARGSLGNPWIFREISEYLRNGALLPRPDREELIRTMREHLDLCVWFHGSKNGVIVFRKFFGWYTKGLRRIRPLKEKVYRLKTPAEMTEAIEKLRSL